MPSLWGWRTSWRTTWLSNTFSFRPTSNVRSLININIIDCNFNFIHFIFTRLISVQVSWPSRAPTFHSSPSLTFLRTSASTRGRFLCSYWFNNNITISSLVTILWTLIPPPSGGMPCLLRPPVKQEKAPFSESSGNSILLIIIVLSGCWSQKCIIFHSYLSSSNVMHGKF